MAQDISEQDLQSPAECAIGRVSARSQCGFKCYRRALVDQLELYGDWHRFTPVLADSMGFRIGELPSSIAPASMADRNMAGPVS